MAAPRLNMVIAACNSGGIGFEGRIPWSLKQDLTFFRTITSVTQDPNRQNAVLMGRKTWFSIPEEQNRPLRNRINVILSHTMVEAPKGTYLARSLSEAVEMVTEGSLASIAESIFVIGGRALYEEAMTAGRFPCRVYLTRVLGDFPCDTFTLWPEQCNFHQIPNPDGIPFETLTENGIDFKIEVHEKDCK